MDNSAMDCLLFGGAVVLLTVVWVCLLNDRSFLYLATAMYFPGAAALLASAYQGDLLPFLQRIMGMERPMNSLVFSAVAMALVYAVVQACARISLACGWATEANSKHKAIHEHNRNRISGFLRAAGEEIGWRCFLLPCLLDAYSPLTAFIISGTVWGLYHVPIMILLSIKCRPPNPVLTVMVQFFCCIPAGVLHGWLAVRSGYSLWASTIMHWFWNVYNPLVLGSIYTNTPGRLAGNQWLINGEGLMGIMVMAPIAVLNYMDIVRLSS